jgi:acetyl-CoA carboxylase biotin carboxylase subunit
MFRRILIANRGEIALRVLRACKELGIETVCVYAKGDEEHTALRLADATICIGPSVATRSYLDVARIVAAAEIAGVEAIHPGYGFLAENARFADICRSCRIGFIGPPPEVIASVGDKVRAKEIAKQAGVPTVPGSEGVVGTEDEAASLAASIGYPVLLKAAAGGGGRGMRIAEDEALLRAGFRQASEEAGRAFGDASLYVEKLVRPARHVEIQILADAHGNVVHLGERDCTVQRRHQKLIEESPSPAVSSEVRRAMGDAAVRLARAAGYVNAGTVEFLLDPVHGGFYFIEVNARIQVEHPVTEMVTGIDLVKQQIRIAAGERLPFRQDEIRLSGFALECRVNAEDPDSNFRPSPGRIERYVAPGGLGVRVESHVFDGYVVPPHYDSLVAKVVVHRAEGRGEAIQAMLGALEEMRIEGIRSTLPFHRRVLRDPKFRSGVYDTRYVDEFFAAPAARARSGTEVAT